MRARQFPSVQAFASIVLVSLSVHPAAAHAAGLNTLKNLRLGMTLAEAKALPGGANAFSGDSMRCVVAGALQTCRISSDSIANIPAQIDAIFVSVAPSGPIGKVVAPPKYVPSAADVRNLEPEELAAKKAKLDQARAVALRESQRAAYQFQTGFKLAYLYIAINHDSYGELSSALREKYGSSGRSSTDTYQTALNAKYEGTSTIWQDSVARVSLTERCERIDQSCLMLSDNSLMPRVEAVWQQWHRARQKDL